MNIIKKLNIFKKGPAPYEAEGFRSGFAILFAVTLSALLLSIALGVSNIALKELKFGTSAKFTNEAFFAADTGVECALAHDKSDSGVFIDGGIITLINCAGSPITVGGFYPAFNFFVPGLGSNGQGCAMVEVFKETDPLDPTRILTTITSKGYDLGGGAGGCDPASNRVERQIETTY